MSRSFSQRALAPFHSTEAERVQRFPSQAANHESRLPRPAPIRQDKPWKWLVRCGPLPSVHTKNIPQIAAAVKCLESIRQQPELSACSPSENVDKATGARPAPISG